MQGWLARNAMEESPDRIGGASHPVQRRLSAGFAG
jgi:hypothetical protein